MGGGNYDWNFIYKNSIEGVARMAPNGRQGGLRHKGFKRTCINDVEDTDRFILVLFHFV